MLSQIYTPGWSADDGGGDAAAPHMAAIPPFYKFHGFPLYWLLPSSHLANAVVPASVFDAVEAVPAGTPRIFLSHMPVEYFEYDPAPGTTILYLLREPHAVWGESPLQQQRQRRRRNHRVARSRVR